MTIPHEIDTLHFDRRCVAHYFHGTLPVLLIELHHSGHAEVTLDDIEARGAVMHDAFGVGVLSKKNCYVCNAPAVVGKLCGCYDDVVAKRHFNVHSAAMLATLAPEVVVETIYCGECGELAGVTAESALKSHQRNNTYVPRKRCYACYKAKHVHTGPKCKAKQPETASIDMLTMASQATTSGQA